MKTKLESFMSRILKDYSEQKGFDLPQPLDAGFSVSKDPAHGDFACNVAFKLAKPLRQKPKQIADDLVALILKTNVSASDAPGIEKAEVAGGGFINIYLTKGCLASILLDIYKQDRDYGTSDFGKGAKVLMEYVSANPTGPLTVAHGRQAAVGDSLSRVLKKTGYAVSSEYYLNDAGRQMNLLGESLWARYQESLGMKAALPEDGYQGDYLKEIAKKLQTQEGDRLTKLSLEEARGICRKFAAEEMMGWIREDLKAFDVRFDSYYNESTLHEDQSIENALAAMKEKGHLFEEGGAVWFRSTDFGDDKDRVVRKSSGELTYLAPDIAYHQDKFKRGYARLIDFLGPDHHGYIARLQAGCQALGHQAGQLNVRIVQLVSLYRKGEQVRMSTRAGEFVTLRELIDEVGCDAARYFFVMRRLESHLDFDLDLAKEKSQDNPVYYLQYAHARVASILRFSESKVDSDVRLELLATAEENDLMKKLQTFPEVLRRASETLEPYRIADFLRECASSFHRFYSHRRVVSEDAELTKARLLLVDATRIVIRNGLELLGISQPEQM